MTQAVAIDTANYQTKYADDLPVRVGGTVFMAMCPKDTVWNALGQAAEDGEDANFGDAELRSLVGAVFGQEHAPTVLAMLDDPANREVNLESLTGVLGECMKLWGPEVQAHFERLQAGSGNRTQRRAVAGGRTPAARAAKTAAAKKTAAKKTAAKKTAAAARGK